MQKIMPLLTLINDGAPFDFKTHEDIVSRVKSLGFVPNPQTRDIGDYKCKIHTAKPLCTSLVKNDEDGHYMICRSAWHWYMEYQYNNSSVPTAPYFIHVGTVYHDGCTCDR